jgi:hypothetical protein
MSTVAPPTAPVDAALAYAARGWRVLPLHNPDTRRGCSCARGLTCETPGKHPRIQRWQERATKDEGDVRRWWGFWPDANIGIATGDGLNVLDVDPRHGGLASLDALEEEHGELHTLAVRTGSGGLHLYFAGDLPTNDKLPAGLEWKGAGRQVVAPPSLHVSGRRYGWIPDQPTTPQLIPPWLANIVQPPRKAYQARPADVVLPQGRYIEAAIVRECMDVLHAPIGERNNQLNKAAWALARFVVAGRARRDPVIEALTAAALGAGLGEREIELTIQSAFDARETG